MGADAIVALHFAFVVFVVLGALLVLRWPRVACFHVPAVIWGALVEFTGWICPLTPLENSLRRRAGEAGYSGGFVEHYLLGLIYPEGLTRPVQLGLGLGVLLFNAVLYGWLVARRIRAARAPLR